METLKQVPEVAVLNGLINGKVTGETSVVFNREQGVLEHPIPMPETPHRVRRLPTLDQLQRYLDDSKPPFVSFNLKTGEFEG